MIIVTPQDFRRLSKACQLELISMMGYAEATTGYSGESISGFAGDEEIIADLYMQKPRHPTANDIVGDKQVIDITNWRGVVQTKRHQRLNQAVPFDSLHYSTLT